MSDKLITLFSIQKYYDSNFVIKDVSLTIKKGDVCVLLGENGCGKTTLLRILCGLESSSSGVVQKTALCQSMSYISQRCSLLPWRSALANITLALEFAGIQKKEQVRRAHQCLEVVGLEDYGHHLPHQLSGGMRQKVALARAIATESKVICMDEPFNALDFNARADAQVKTLDLCDRLGIAIVFVTHDIDEALRMATKLYLLSSSPTTVLEKLSIDRELSEHVLRQHKNTIYTRFNENRLAVGDMR